MKNLKQTHVRDFLLTVCDLPSDWAMVFAPDFDSAETLAREECPRCATVGLMPSDYDATTLR